MIRALLVAVMLSFGVYLAASPAPVLASAPPLGQQVDISPLPKATAGNGKVQQVLIIIFTIMGALALLMLTIGGFRYVASQGDPKASAQAKGTITYALIGLLVCILSVSIVTFVTGAL